MKLIKREQNLLKFIQMISHDIEFNKGELITLVRDIGRRTFNKYLNLDFKDNDDMVRLMGSSWLVLIYSPYIPLTENYYIRSTKLKGNNSYKDDFGDSSNPDILLGFLDYLQNKIHFEIK